MGKGRIIAGPTLGAVLSMLGLAACGRSAGVAARDGGGGTGGNDASAGDMTTSDAGEASVSLLYHSGSRLKARYIDAGGGARKFEDWYDTKLASPCAFQFTEDGVLRCAPMANSVLSGVDFADAACSEPIAYLPGSSYEAPYFVSEAGRTYPTSCPKDLSELTGQSVNVLVDVWRIGGRRAVPAAMYFRGVGGGCTMRAPSEVQEVYSVEKVQPSEMVSATSRVEPRGAALAVTLYDTEDGARMVGPLFDAKELQPCTPSWVWTASGDYRCYPSAPTRTPGPPPACGAASFCPGDLAIGYGARCGAATLQRSSTCEMADSTKSPSLISDLLGTGAVKLVVTRATDDARPLFVNPLLWSAVGSYRPGPFFDTAADRTCDAVTIDGALRCAPTDTAVAQTYADSACTQLVLLQTPDQPNLGCDGATASAPRLALGGTPIRLYRVGNSTHLDQTWHTALPPDTGCQPSGVPADVYELAPEDASSLPLLTKSQD